MGCVYIAINKVNGKCYVGKTVKSLRTRKNWHIAAAERGEGYRFHRAIRKYGIESFQWEILVESEDPKSLEYLEKEFIISRNSKSPNGYNLTEGGDGTVGRAPEVTAKIVAFHTGRKRSKETRDRISKAAIGQQRRLGIKLSEESKKKLSKSLKGKIVSKEAREKIGNYQRGRPKTEEQKKKMSEARKLWWKKRKQKEDQDKQKSPSLFDIFGEQEDDEQGEQDGD